MRIFAYIGVVVVLVFSSILGQDDVETCFSCHDDNELTGSNHSGEEISMLVLPENFAVSVHGDLECIDCHEDLSGFDDYPHEEDLAVVDCGLCHEEQVETYQWHGRAKVSDGGEIPTCADCHGKHDILSVDNTKSRVHPLNIPETCNRCHMNIDLINKHELLYSTQVMEAFESSVHGQASAGGIHLAATCNDCHSTAGTAHRILGPGQPESSIGHFEIPKTCGRCHPSIMNDFYEGIHGKLAAQGETDSPVCTNCHGEHGILSPSDPLSSVSPTRVAEATCSPCHESAYLNEKYGAPTGRLQSWYDSYHGLKSKAGDVTVANCASCHGAHRILPRADSSSSIHPSHLQQTCASCHPGISPALAAIPIHATPGVSQTPLAQLIANIYIIIIFVAIGIMILHWLIDLRMQIHLSRMKKQIRRMTLNAVWQHTILMVSFTVLVITGFSLRYSEAFWVQWLFGWEGGFPLRGIIHRVAAVVFTLGAVWHIGYLWSATGRQFLRDMFPAKSDFSYFLQMIKYNLGKTDEKPRFGRFGYVEKVEYWSLVWGAIVMVITGFFLWFDDLAVMWFPKGFLDVMLVVHFYEAWLAALAILTWHMYSTVFSPGVYPMNTSWLDGQMSLEAYKHEHPADPVLAGHSDEEETSVDATDGLTNDPGSDATDLDTGSDDGSAQTKG
ncbi:MAG: hypothetical protein J7J98_08050 [candidate division Zixibacteria bacterium]|nr:hypothetical protein [candidate division Zixibacteria bacterium]